MFNTHRDVEVMRQRKDELMRQAEMERLAREARNAREALPGRWARLVNDILRPAAEPETAADTDK